MKNSKGGFWPFSCRDPKRVEKDEREGGGQSLDSHDNVACGMETKKRKESLSEINSQKESTIACTSEIEQMITETGGALFEKLLRAFPSNSSKDTVCILNSALFFMSLVQNTLYSPEERDSFVDNFAASLKKNNWKED